MPDILVTAIVSVFNGEKFMHGCMDDLLRQTIGKKIEIIVIDSGSSQGEKGIVDYYRSSYSHQIKYIRTERETIYSAWNRGLSMAEGKYITNANVDDRHRPDALEVMVNAIEKNNVGIVYGDTLMTHGRNEIFECNKAVCLWKQPDWNLLQGFVYCPFGPQPLWKRDIHPIVGGFNVSRIVSGDYELFLKIARAAGAYHIKENLGLYWINKESLSFVNPRQGVSECRDFIGKMALTWPIDEIYGLQNPAAEIKSGATLHFAGIILRHWKLQHEHEELHRRAFELCTNPSGCFSLPRITDVRETRVRLK